MLLTAIEANDISACWNCETHEEIIAMSAGQTIEKQTRDSAAAFVWGFYRAFAAAARLRKKELVAWRERVLTLSIAGAIFATLCQWSTGWGLEDAGWRWLPNFFGGASAIALGVAMYFGKEILDPEQERRWIRTRSLAESLKAQAYLFLAGASPYEGIEAAELVLKKTEQLLETAKDLPTNPISDQDKSKGLPPNPLSVNQYIQIRVNDQINNFYHPKANENKQIMRRGRRIGLILGGLAVVFGALGSSGWTAAWVAAITTITVAITAYLFAGRYQYLLISYQATARRLELLRARWETSGRTDADTAERNRFLLECEEAISIENSAWMAEFTKEVK